MFLHRPQVARAFRTTSAVTAFCVAVTALVGGALFASPAAAAGVCSSSTLAVTRVSTPVLYIDLGDGVNSAYEAYRIVNTTGVAIDDLWVTSGSFAGPRIGLAPNSDGRTHIGPLGGSATAYAYFYLTSTGATTAPEAHTISTYTTRPDLASAAHCTFTVTQTSDTDIAASANKVTSTITGPTPPQLGGIVTMTVSGDAGMMGAAGLFATSPASYSSWRSDAYKLIGSAITIGGTTYNDVLFLSGLPTGGNYTVVFTFAAIGTTATPTSLSPMSHISSGTQVKHTTINATYTALAPIQPAANIARVTMAAASPTGVGSGGGTITYTATVHNGGSIPVTLDDLTVTLPTGETYVAGSATWAGAPTGEPGISGSTLAFVRQFTVAAGASTVFTFQGLLPAISNTYVTSIVGHVSVTQIDTTTLTTDNAPGTASATVAGPPPAVTAVSPANGTNHGGTSVTISGTGFSGATAVMFGTTAARSYTVVNATTITAVTPAGTAGIVDVTVTTPNGTSSVNAGDEYTYVTAVNNAPVYTGAGTNTSQSILVGGTLTALAATDADGDALTYAVTSGSLPAGISLSSNGTFTGTATTAGTTTAGITVSDGFSGSAVTSLVVTVTGDSTPPVIAISGGATVNTLDTTPTISGTTDEAVGATVTISIGGQTLTATVQSGGTWSATAATLTDGTYTVTARVSDAAGNVGTATQQIIVDTVAPTVSITGGAARSTNDTTPSISGTTNAPAGSAVVVTVNGQTLNTTVQSGGTWSVTATSLGQGTYPVDVLITDAAGNDGTAAQSLTIDTTAPGITISGGASVIITNNTPTISGATDAGVGRTVTVSVGGQTLTTPVQSGGTWSVTPTALADGTHTVIASVSDPAGNVATATQQLTIDTTAPVITISGGSARSTNDNTPAISGTTDAPVGATVTITVGGQTLTTTVQSGGTWSATAGSLADATYTVTAGVSDSAGNAATATQQLTIDISAPSIAITGGSAVTTGNNTPLLTGTTDVPVGSTVTVTIAGQTLTATVQSGGTWSVPAGTVPDGTHAVVATVVDAAGNSGRATQQLVVDTVAPAITITGGSARATNDNTPDIAGTTDAAAGSSVTVTVGGQTLTAIVQAGGGWSVTAAALSDATYTVVARVSDAAGNTRSASQQLTIDTTPPAVALVDGGSGTATSTPDSTPTITGTSTAPAGSTVTVTVGGQTLTGTVAPDGTWAVTAAPLVDGSYSVTAVTVDALGNSSTSVLPLVIATPPLASPPALTSGATGDATQTVTVSVPAKGAVALLDASGTPATIVVIPGQGTYALDSSTGVITFVPVTGFSGTATPVNYRVTDAYDQTAVATYTATTIPAPVAAIVDVSVGAPTEAHEPQTATLTVPLAPARRPLPAAPAKPVPRRLVASVWTPELSVMSARTGSVPITCGLSAGLIDRCEITLYAMVSGRQVVVGRGAASVGASRSSRRLVVLVTLNPLGRALAAQPGGARLIVQAAILRRGSKAVMRPVRSTQVVAQTFVVARPVFFESDRFVLRPSEVAYLTQLRTRLAGVRSITCTGYADGESSQGYNVRLGMSRAKVVCAFLTRGKSIPVRLVTMGENRPHATNATARGRALNRRTEIGLGY